ncbi:hypothetical protein MATR_06020 [Marivirga tractuosa]|uniref:DUF6089 domain-containing protein n=1 Tax=Marivirga tractuosa (strain ATCC 23168 / DSM 4126 / NBRC 15989 / NCIMB 1408 / VKM B-1430 / H-43) TaxID=643867 RepID=E4TRP4_MARTH|nr:hypothetical protein [Marivirga tractuosa]ADR21765.1 hypothetical protein Ftrac_1777 [Marivirga tractuosa DSM 4126]BDD13777.1 hypothetical protein MATR_06020 [Marivirga tractuosa]
MKKLILSFSIVMSAMMIMPDFADAQLFGGKNKRRRGNRKIGSFSGSKRLFNPEISYFAFGGGINALNYFGEIAPRPTTLSTDISFTRPGVNLFLKQKFGDRYSWKVNFMWGRLNASDTETVGTSNFTAENANRYLRNLDFRNDIFELSFQGQLDLFKHGGRFSSRPPLNIYAFFGVGVIYHNPKGLAPQYFTRDPYLVDNPIDFLGGSSPRYYELEQAGQWVSLRDLGTEGQFFDAETRAEYQDLYEKELPQPYSRIQIVLPVGIGARYKLTNNLDIALEIGYRHTFTDYLDDVSGEYVDLSGFGDPSTDPNAALAMAMSDKSNQFDAQTFNENILPAIYTSRISTYNTALNPDFTWSRAAGYGKAAGIGNDDVRRNNRGNQNDNDIYIVTNISVTYIMGGGFVRGAKFR